jgi:hypothetical protein
MGIHSNHPENSCKIVETKRLRRTFNPLGIQVGNQAGNQVHLLTAVRLNEQTLIDLSRGKPNK